MNDHLKSLAYFGSMPYFSNLIRNDCRNIADWKSFKKLFNKLFQNGWYTNHGPLAQELEKRLESLLKVKHVICVTNETIGLSLAMKALGLQKKVIVPALSFAGTVQSLIWSNLEPVFCDVDIHTHMINESQIKSAMNNNVTGVIGVHMWGNSCDNSILKKISNDYDIKLFYDATHAFGCTFNQKFIGNLGELEVFSFHESTIINSFGGGAISTNNDKLAAYIRNSRSSYGRGKLEPVSLTGNGRFSEAQAALAILSLDNYEQRIKQNLQKEKLYKSLLNIPGISFINHPEDEKTNYQYVAIQIDEEKFGLSKKELAVLLKAENIIVNKSPFFPLVYLTHPANVHQQYISTKFENAISISNSLIQLPSSEAISFDTIKKICEIIIFIYENSTQIKKKLR